MQRLTESAVSRLDVEPGERDSYLWDGSLPGFGVRAFASGAKSFIVKYALSDGRQRKMSLGAVQPGMLNEARKAAASILLKAKSGVDVAGDKKAIRERAKRDKRTKDLIDDYLAMKRREVRSSSFTEIQRHLIRFAAPIHDKPVESIGRRDIVPIIDELTNAGKRVQADRTKSSLVTFFNWAIERDLVAANPATGISRRTPAEEVSRDRVLHMDELATVWNATGGHGDYDRIIRLLMLTGCRADEIGKLEWSEIDFEKRQIHLPAIRTKNKREHRVFLSPPGLAILQSATPQPKKAHVFGRTQDCPFSGWSKSKERLDEKLGESVRPWRVHDLRRSMATNCSDLGLAPIAIIEMALGHWSGEKSGIVRTYNRSTHDAERRKLMDDWANAVQRAAQ